MLGMYRNVHVFERGMFKDNEFPSFFAVRANA